MKRELTHEEADNLAQRVLGNIEPFPGESYEGYKTRVARADAAFAAAHPNWRNAS